MQDAYCPHAQLKQVFTAMSVRSNEVHVFGSVAWQSTIRNALLITCLGIFFWEGMRVMVDTWMSTEEYSHGPLIPLITGFLLWQKWDRIRLAVGKGSWSGVWILGLGAALNIVGKLAAVFVLQQYSLIIVLAGLILSFGGWRLLKEVAVPLVLLLFMIPLPGFFFNSLSAQLQLISSQIGVSMIRLFGVSVFVEGNVIDLGAYKLQVADACSGLRYLFPLMTLGFIAAYFFKSAWWKRAIVFLSSIPITILMNSFRIGTIGLMVDRWGTGMAEGFLHEFQGWAVFMSSALVMLGEIVILAKIGSRTQPWREVFGVDMPERRRRAVRGLSDRTQRSFVAASFVLVIFTAAFLVMPTPGDAATAPRASFASFPSQIDRWSGRRAALDKIYIDTLKFDDYLLSDFRAGSHSPVNLYVAWYDRQRAGQSAHSPRSCIPGGGWRITNIDQQIIEGSSLPGGKLAVNRVRIESGAQKQIVYYWFQQRGRIITNEYLVKWYLLLDSLTLHRTDGALIRLIAPVGNGETEAVAEQQLREFAGALLPVLTRYVPG